MQHTRAACSEGINFAKKALSRKGWSQAYLATQVVVDDDNRLNDLPVSTSTVKRFFQGRKIRAALFGGICAALELDPDQIEMGEQLLTEEIETQLWSVPYSRNPFLTGRGETLQQIRMNFEAAVHMPTCQALTGLGGIGKTQVALEYAYRYEFDYQAVFWVRAHTETDRLSSFLDVARHLGFPLLTTQSHTASVQAVLQWLAENDDWLLIFDDADHPAELKPFCPKRGQGHILVTSRAPRFDDLGIARPIKIETLSLTDSVSFLFQRTGREAPDSAEQSAAHELASEVGFLPLALEQAGSYVLDRQMRFQDYVPSYRQHRFEVLQRSLPVMGNYSQSVSTTWLLNFRQVERQAPAAAELLKVTAFLAPDAVPYELFEHSAAVFGTLSLASVLSTAINDPSCIVELLAPLAQYSLVSIDLTSRTYSMHRLVKEAVRHYLVEESAEQTWITLAVQAVSLVFPEVEFESWAQCDRLLPHGLASQHWIEQLGYQSLETAQLLNRVGHYLVQQGRYEIAAPILQLALSQRQQLLGDTHLDVAESQYRLGSLYRAQGRYAEAEALYLKSLELREKLLDVTHLEVASVTNALALLYRDQGRLAEAEPLHQAALNIRQSALEDDHPDVAASLNDLAITHWKQNCHETAEPLFEQALEMYYRLGSDTSPAVAICTNNLALLYKSQGRYEAAEPLYQKTVKIYQKLVGEDQDHPFIATALHNWAGLHKVKGEYDLAQQLYTKAMTMRLKLLGDHPHLASTMHHLASVYVLQGSYGDAEVLYQKALELRSRLLGEQHSATLKTLDALQALQSLIQEEDALSAR